MKNQLMLSFLLCSLYATAQVGVGTTTPNSTLDVRGSLSGNVQAFTSAYTATGTDYNLIFTGTSAATLTLPTAVGITGRMYAIKNASSNTSTLTIATTLSQTIDGSATQLLNNSYQTLTVVSDGSNWQIVGYSLPGGSGADWLLGGNSTGTTNNFGTKTNYDLPFITNNTEKMRLTSTGNLGIGTSTFSGTNPEKLKIDAGSSSSYQNVIVAKGNTTSYAQFNIQNINSGGNASTDIVATADNGDETTNYVDLGINSSNYNNGASSLLNGGDVAYLYNYGQDLVIGNASASKSIIFFTGGDAPSNEKFRINSSGVVLNSAMTFNSAGVSSDILPSATSTYNLGSNTKRWNTIYSVNTLNTSDARLKKDIARLNYGLDAVMNLRPVSYYWKDNSEKGRKIGFLAQELRNVIPEVVVGDESKENLAVNYIELIPVLVKAIQEQQKQIEALQTEISNMKRKH